MSTGQELWRTMLPVKGETSTPPTACAIDRPRPRSVYNAVMSMGASRTQRRQCSLLPSARTAEGALGFGGCP